MFAGLLSTLVLLVRPDAMGAEVLLAAGLLTAALAVVAVLRTLAVPASVTQRPAGADFTELRVLGGSDASAPGHRRARAPGSTR